MRAVGQPHPESAERVEWTETRNLATEQGDRAGRIMAATAEASPELKRLAGAAATGRKLEKPVCHYSLNWAKEEKPDRQAMLRAAEESLKALGMERHQALIVSHRDGQPHVHVIANRVDPEKRAAALKEGLAAGFGSPEYAREELRAEICAMMTGERVGVGHDPQRGATYVENWVRVLEEDPREIHRAAAEAQRMSDYLISQARGRSMGSVGE